MKKGFTLIELIFAIVIIGVLAAVAVPQFTNLKQNAEVKSVIKLAEDTYGAVPSAFVNEVDLNEGTVTTINELVGISGKGWAEGTDGTVTYTDPTTGGGVVVTLVLDTTDRNIKISYDCSNFSDTKSQAKCQDSLGLTDPTTTLDKNVSF